MKIGLFVKDVKLTALQELIIVKFVAAVYDEWIIIVHGLLI